MRDFKFRAWDKKENKMFEVKNINLHNEFLNCNPKLPMQHCQCLQFKNCVLLQFTGLKDKDGNEIYEGDIVRFQGDYPAFFEESFFKVKHGYYNNELGYEDHICGYGWYGHPIKKTEDGKRVSFDEKEYLIPGDELCDGVVGGNIFENPELLKEEE